MYGAVLEHLGLTRDRWDALPWHDARMYLEHLEQRGVLARSGGPPPVTDAPVGPVPDGAAPFPAPLAAGPGPTSAGAGGEPASEVDDWLDSIIVRTTFGAGAPSDAA